MNTETPTWIDKTTTIGRVKTPVNEDAEETGASVGLSSGDDVGVVGKTTGIRVGVCGTGDVGPVFGGDVGCGTLLGGDGEDGGAGVGSSSCVV
mmetsp:Transcript_26910/g.64225  ORF Transcript_26910/g.64225 Transcript_26910/m.64225 type:complete len:93 (+) Transcript_26910:87-365(+)